MENAKVKSIRKGMFFEIVRETCGELGVSKAQVFRKTKKRNIVDARHIIYYSCFNSGMRVSTICNYMIENGYDIAHNSIINGIRSITERRKHEKFIRYTTDLITDKK
ncbi:MAG: hypothetical protein [Podoviridae sp. ctrTa16]|nr:MAG: hypothetical protein [Podoviridae sp. ctrTa16]